MGVVRFRKEESLQEAKGKDLRRVGLHPDNWAPVARSRQLKPGRLLSVSFAGQPIALARSEAGTVFALEDRCAHRQVPLSEGLVSGETVKCGYHGWAYGADGRCVDVPYLGKGEAAANAVRRYPCREAYGFIFVFPGDPAKAEGRFPDVPSWSDPEYKTRVLDRMVRCHYSFMHENLLDMNHQFLHRSLMGGIRPTLLGLDKGPDWTEAVYTFERVSGSQPFGERFMIGGSAGARKRREHDVMTIRTQYPFQLLRYIRSDADKPALDLWLSYAPVDAEQRVNHSLGLMMVRRPGIPGLIHLFWPFIVAFTEGIFRQDRRVVELEQKAWDAQGGDRNRVVFPVIRALREVLAANGTPIAA
ncbi:MAG: aromatic ring-hydroxylating dioxygenase subunit alpha [Elusimicrobia bacterium]|nr:aromatic ring-hydroxylating dioxygenase subunit alpha [Elusimicrobiota bacterium]